MTTSKQGAASRRKGAAFENAIARKLRDLMALGFERNLDQSRKADQGDIVCDNPAFPFMIECKRRKAGTDCKASWWRQAGKAAHAAGKIPAVVFKFDHQPIRVRIPLEAVAMATGSTLATVRTVDVYLEDVAFLAGAIMRRSVAAASQSDVKHLRPSIA